MLNTLTLVLAPMFVQLATITYPTMSLSVVSTLSLTAWIIMVFTEFSLEALSMVPAIANRYRRNDPRALGPALCVKTVYSDPQSVRGNACPSGYNVLSLDDAYKHKDELCDSMDDSETVRIGYKGSITGWNDGCEVYGWDESDISQTFCVKTKIQAYKIFDSQDSLCGVDMSFVTVSEVLTDQQGYCNLIPADKFVRLSGGASLGGADYGCQILADDRRNLKFGLCGSGSRSNINGSG